MSNDHRTAISVDGVSHRYGRGDWLIDRASFAVGHSESVALMGPSGVGKSTMLSLVLGLVDPGRGTVSVAGKDWSTLTRAQRASHRSENIGMVFQFGELIDELSPAENVGLPLMWSGHRGGDPFVRAAALLDDLGVTTTAATAAVVSGGERQRIAVARALVANPPVVLADEPTGSLDSQNAASLADMLFALPSQRGCALLVVTHSDEVANRADRVLELTAHGIVSR